MAEVKKTRESNRKTVDEVMGLLRKISERDSEILRKLARANRMPASHTKRQKVKPGNVILTN